MQTLNRTPRPSSEQPSSQPSPGGRRGNGEGRSSRPDQNSHIRAGTEAYIRCLAWLMVKGFTLIKVDIGGDHALPVIHIQTGGLCNLFKERYNAVCYGFRGEHGVRVDTWRAEVFGCRVEWVERGH